MKVTLALVTAVVAVTAAPVAQAGHSYPGNTPAGNRHTTTTAPLFGPLLPYEHGQGHPPAGYRTAVYTPARNRQTTTAAPAFGPPLPYEHGQGHPAGHRAAIGTAAGAPVPVTTLNGGFRWGDAAAGAAAAGALLLLLGATVLALHRRRRLAAV
ncbi:MAG TPA: hypothetical protein VFA66_03825 [Gaiellaceae bacterium]|nr:hypothetical protein [Gaiellaceae bacterium]